MVRSTMRNRARTSFRIASGSMRPARRLMVRSSDTMVRIQAGITSRPSRLEAVPKIPRIWSVTTLAAWSARPWRTPCRLAAVWVMTASAIVRIGSGMVPSWACRLATQAWMSAGAGSLPATMIRPFSRGGTTSSATPTSSPTASSSARRAARTRGMNLSSRLATGRTA